MSKGQGLLHDKESELGGIEQSIKQLQGLLQTATTSKQAEYQQQLDKLNSKREALVNEIDKIKEDE
ncbi:hypothetical protein [Spartinivicinus ruber]|uniref:hypothetical protein n=1 Tax=Spartinivicinus ruber TaxID=2683272 RepID=UPI0013D58563|nr:hypothetical protein [Spartinivicinus ruber]